METFAHKVFRLGPVLIVPVMIAGSVAYSPWRHYDSWPAYVILLGLPVALIWHLVLITMERPRAGYVLYAAVNLLLYLFVGLRCLYVVAVE